MPDTLNGQNADRNAVASSLTPPSDSHPLNISIWFVTVLAFLATTLLGAFAVVTIENNRLRERQKTVSDIAASVADSLNDHLTRALSSTYALAAIIRQNEGRIDNFEPLATEMLGLYGGISSLQLVPDGVVTAIVPLKGNEKAIGHDLLKDSKRNREALLAKRTRQLTLAGPFELIQGGQAVIGRLPVYLRASNGTDFFWGFTAAMIRIPELCKDANLQKIVAAGYNYELSRTHPDTSKRDIFARSTGEALRSPIRHAIEVPNATWTLAVEPAGGWFSPPRIFGEVVIVLLVSSLAAMLINTFSKQPIILRKMVDERTQQISEANRKLTSEIEERKRAQEELGASEARLRESQRVAHVGHYEFDPVSGGWTSSEELDAIYGIGADYPRDLQGWLQIVHPEEREEMSAYLAQHVLNQRQLFNREYRIQRVSDLAERWMHGLGQLECGDDGRPLKMFGTIQDITERKRAEMERSKLEQQMQHAQKLESLGVLAGGIAHDFNNILLVILGHAELALMRLNPASPARENLHKIEQSAQRAAELARQMLAYSGKGKFVVEAIDLGDLVTEMTHMLEVSISKKAVLRFNLAADLPPVEADSTQMRQVLMNLVINASEAIGDKSGVIAITTGAMQCDRNYLNSTWLDEELSDGLYIFVEVADTGCGMDRETLARLFDPFFTTKFTGRGLGMAAVLGIVRGHNGAIKAYSEQGKGTTFKMLLPAAPGHAGELRRNVAEQQLWHGSGTILLVDDEETIRALGREMLEVLGFTVLTACDGRQALEVFREHGEEIEVVILDLTMPNMDGEQTFRELRLLRTDLRVIMSSGYNEHEVSQRFLGKRMTGFIQKPYKLDALSAILRQVLEG